LPSDKTYDLGISFLHRDEPFALELESKLSETLNVFVYSKRQEELAGTDGLESFRKAFLSDSKLVIVLYRDRWGQTPWTRVEETAIKDRFLQEGWDWLLFVVLDDGSTPPVWLPRTHIRLNYAQYGEALIGAIKLRAQELGVQVKTESVLERAKRLERDSQARMERTRLLQAEGSKAVTQEYDLVCKTMDQKLNELQQHLSSINLEKDPGYGYRIRSSHVSLAFAFIPTHAANESKIVLRQFRGRLRFAQPGRGPVWNSLRDPELIEEVEFHFDYQSAFGWCWYDRERQRFLPSSDLADEILSTWRRR
jgi:hypothetical protein